MSGLNGRSLQLAILALVVFAALKTIEQLARGGVVLPIDVVSAIFAGVAAVMALAYKTPN